MPPKPMKITNRQRKKVMLLVATGMGEREIAVALKMARDTLVHHFSHELMVGRATIRQEIREMLMKAAANGNVTAMKHLDGKTDLGQPAVKQYIGKKEHQAEAAKVAGVGTEWEADLMRVMPQVDDKPN